MKRLSCLALVLLPLGCRTPQTELSAPQIRNEPADEGYYYVLTGTLRNNTGEAMDLWVVCDVFGHGQKFGRAFDAVHLPPEGSATYEVGAFSRGPVDRADCLTSSTPPR